MNSNKKLWKLLLALIVLALLAVVLFWSHHRQTGEEGAAVSKQRNGSGPHEGAGATLDGLDAHSVPADPADARSASRQVLDDSAKDRAQASAARRDTLIARNHEEIERLRRLVGERDYIEFTIEGQSKPQKVGNVTIELRSARPERNLFTLIVVTDGVRQEKRDRTINEPILFYTPGAKQPQELVINRVGKDTVVGYLSIPKINQADKSGS